MMKYIIWTQVLFMVACTSELSVVEQGQHDSGVEVDGGSTEGDLGVDGSVDCVSDKLFFDRTVNPVLVERCGGCHAAVGVASQTNFILESATQYSDHLERNLKNIEGIVKDEDRSENIDQRSVFLLKPLNLVEHEGGNVLAGDTEATEVIEAFIERIDQPTGCEEKPELPYFDGVTFMDGYSQLRRATLLLAGRLPTAEEIQSVDEDINNLDVVFDTIMGKGEARGEDKFYEFLETGWNDILHTRGLIIQNLDAQSNANRRYWGLLDAIEPVPDPNLSDTENRALRDAHNQFFKREEVGAEYAMRHAPVKLISYIVRNDRPFTEILTADYMMVNPFSAKAFDIYEKSVFDPTTNSNRRVKDLFKNTEAKNSKSDYLLGALNYSQDENYPNDANEYVPAQKNGGGKTGIPDGEDFYHAGLLSSVFWRRIVSTDTNVNRARSRMFFKVFLDTDILQLAPRVGGADDAEDVENPVVELSQCSVCHIPMDPVAGLLQHFTNAGSRQKFQSRFGPWDQGYKPGFNGVDLPEDRLDDAERWLGEMAIKDPRFPIAMVVNGLFIIGNIPTLNPPNDTNSFFYTQELRAYEEQRAEILRISDLFVQSNFDFKVIIKAWLKSPLLTAVNLETPPDADRSVELGAVGFSSISTPESLSRKIEAIFGRLWTSKNRFGQDISTLSNEEYIRQGGNDAELYSLYAGIDSKETLERLKVPNGVHGSVMRVLAEDLACRSTGYEFSLAANTRVLFPFVEKGDTLSNNETAIRKNIVYLHERILGERHSVDDPEITFTVQLFDKIQKNGAANGGVYLDTCMISDDDDYSLRSWQSIITFLLSHYQFIYE